MTNEVDVKDDVKLSEDLKNLVVARLDVIPQGQKIAVGSDGEFTKEELIQHVKNNDEIGIKIAEIEITFLRALKDGSILDEILTSDQITNG